MKVGIGITTYNRKNNLRATLKGIFETSKPDIVVVSDDGSTDGTHELRDEFPNVIWLFNENGGIARNKNRLLFRLFAIERCDVVFLMEDDVVPVEKNWLIRWTATTNAYNHVNMRFPWMSEPICGLGASPSPWVSRDLTCQIMGLTSKAWRRCGYMDPRFTGYGYEHIEYSRRLARENMGGWYLAEEDEFQFICLSDEMFRVDHNVMTTGSPEKISEAFEVLKLTTEDVGYKDGWTNQSEFVLECLDKDSENV